MTVPRTAVVPKSGSSIKSVPKTPSMKRCGKTPTEKRRMRSCFLASERASQSTSAIFVSSLGWNVIGPSRSHRVAPPAL